MEKYTAPEMEVVKFDEEAAITLFDLPTEEGTRGFHFPGHGQSGNTTASC